jgi:hypothetical protein
LKRWARHLKRLDSASVHAFTNVLSFDIFWKAVVSTRQKMVLTTSASPSIKRGLTTHILSLYGVHCNGTAHATETLTSKISHWYGTAILVLLWHSSCYWNTHIQDISLIWYCYTGVAILIRYCYGTAHATETLTSKIYTGPTNTTAALKSLYASQCGAAAFYPTASQCSLSYSITVRGCSILSHTQTHRHLDHHTYSRVIIYIDTCQSHT